VIALHIYVHIFEDNLVENISQLRDKPFKLPLNNTIELDEITPLLPAGKL
jgi:hypothetical protein